LKAWTSRRKTAQALALRARIVLAAAGQLTNAEIAELEGVSRPTVTKWRNRFAERRLEGLMDEPRPGRPRTITDQDVEEVVIKTLESSPRDATHWSTRSMARETGIAPDSVMRIWHAFGLQPHRRQTWKLSKDPQLVEKVHDICGCTWTRPSVPWSSPLMRRARFKRWIGPRRRCQCCPARLSEPPTTTSATAPRASTPP
jgi:transposase